MWGKGSEFPCPFQAGHSPSTSTCSPSRSFLNPVLLEASWHRQDWSSYWLLAIDLTSSPSLLLGILGDGTESSNTLITWFLRWPASTLRWSRDFPSLIIIITKSSLSPSRSYLSSLCLKSFYLSPSFFVHLLSPESSLGILQRLLKILLKKGRELLCMKRSRFREIWARLSTSSWW